MTKPQPTTEEGDPKPKPKSKRTTLTMKPELWEQVEQISKAKGLEPLDTLRWLLSEGVAYYQQQHPERGDAANGTKPKTRRKGTGANHQARDGPHPLL